MNKPIIIVKNISKKYNITHERGSYVAMRDVLTNIAKKPFSFLKKKAEQITGRNTNEEFWALKDIDFEIQAGEAVGIIGANGAGKSTLLKILTGITPPTTGEIRMHGKVASLLEVGTGFHSELTGRENIFLNGAILGMTKKEIAEKFDAIVEFSGVGKFIDTPVKRYSSGMLVRLGFSVAAHMEPDILLVDEVLAVGDAEFQKKCLGKMDEVTSQAGRTILFVSHNLEAVKKLCKRCILIENGKIKMIGETKKVISHYLNKIKEKKAVTEFEVDQKKKAQITRVSILDKNKKPTTNIPISQNFFIKTEYKVLKKVENALFSILFYSSNTLLLKSSESDKTKKLKTYSPGKYATVVEIPSFLFNVGNYNFTTAIHEPCIESFDHKKDIYFEITDVNNPKSLIFKGSSEGQIATVLDYSTDKYS
ncbi:MAG: ABC transporter ATP-binding protein [Patescibacteria group bacterium]